MVTSALDYSQLASIYDDYCRFAGDVDFFRRLVAGVRGRVLELMAGTGRLSLPLAETGARLTGVDSSLSMLAVLDGKNRNRASSDPIAPLCADVTELPFRPCFELALLPFQGFTELLRREDQVRALRSVYGVLEVGGRFVLTSHNPPVRLRSVDESWHEIGTFDRLAGGTVRISLRGRYDPASRLVVGRQRVEIEDDRGERAFELDLRFSLVSVDELLQLVRAAGFGVQQLLGDYEGGVFDPETSPAIIAVLEKGG